MLKGGSGYRSLRLGRGGKQGAEGRGEGGAFSRLETPWSVAPLTPGHSGSPAPGGRGLGGDGLPGDGRLCPGFPKEPRAGRRAVYEVGEAQGLASAPRGGRWPGRCRGPGVVAWGGAGLCPRRGRHDAEVRGGLDDPRETQLGEGSDRPQRPAGAPGSPRAHRRQVGSGSCGLCWVPRPESGGNRPELLLRPEAACAPGDACQGGPAGSRSRFFAVGSAHRRQSLQGDPHLGQPVVQGSGLHRPTGPGKAPRGEGRARITAAPGQSQGCEAPWRRAPVWHGGARLRP